MFGTTLEIVKKLSLIGKNEWAVALQSFKRFVKAHEKTFHDVESLNEKFEMLDSVKEPAGYSSCPPNVRPAKNIARNV